MNLLIASQSPTHEAIHLDLAGRTVPIDRGVVLTLTDPSEILAAAHSSAAGVDWVLWEITTMPASERRVAAFAVSVARNVRGTVFVILNTDSGRGQRIAGHLLRAGARQHTG